MLKTTEVTNTSPLASESTKTQHDRNTIYTKQLNGGTLFNTLHDAKSKTFVLLTGEEVSHLIGRPVQLNPTNYLQHPKFHKFLHRTNNTYTF